MKLRSLLSLFILILVGNLELYSQIIISTINENDHVTIKTEVLKVQVQKNPWCISVYDKNDIIILNENENNLFVFSDDKISEYINYTSLGYDTIIKRDPPFYHLYDESVIIGESILFECATAKSKNVNVYITFRSPFVFSVWITLPEIVEPVKHSFISDDGEHFFGLGECWDARSLDLKGLSITMNNRTGTPDQGGYIPFYMSTNGYGILVDNNLNVNFDFSNENEVTITAPSISNSEDGAGYFYGTSFLYYFYYGPDLLDVVDRFTGHVSRPALPPSWALFSTWQWRNTITESQAYDDAQGMRDANIPCGLIWIDRPWAQGDDNMPPPFEWEVPRFPNGSQMCQDLQDQGYKTGVWVAKNLYGSFSDSLNYIQLKNDTKTFLERDNCQMYKIDRGNVQSIDPLFTCQAYYEAWEDVFKGDFVTLPRTIANRAQQYVSGKWPGDNNNTYDYPSGLKANIAAMLNLAIAGFPFWGGDTGGFPDPPGNNVTARWAQFSSMCTIFETAGTPYTYNQKYRDIYKKYAELYTRLYPYRWTYARLAHEKGYPVTRALVLSCPQDEESYNQKFEYMYGEWILVAPVVDATFSRDVYLPQGKWYDWWDGSVYNGPVTIEDYPAPEDILPLFVKAGAIIPLIDVQNTWLNSTIDPLTFRIYPKDKSKFRILGDTIIYQGKDKPYTDLKTTNIGCVTAEDKIEITTGAFEQSFIFEIHHNQNPLSVKINDETINPYNIIDLKTIDEGYFFDESNGGIIWIKVKGREQTSNLILISLPETSVVQEYDNNVNFNVVPNPIIKNGKVVFNFHKKTKVQVEVFDILGRQVVQLTNKEYLPGIHELILSAEQLNRGIYILNCKAFGQNKTKLISLE